MENVRSCLTLFLSVLALLSTPAGARAFQHEKTGPPSSQGVQSSRSEGGAPGLPEVAGLPAVDLSSPESVRTQRASWPHRLNVWSIRGRYVLENAYEAVDAARDAAGPTAAPGFLADLALLQAMIAVEQRAYVDAEALLEKAQGAFQQEKDKTGEALAAGVLGILETARNHPVKAEHHLQEAIGALSKTNETSWYAFFQVCLADVHLRRDQIENLVAEYQAAIDAAKEAGDAFVEGLGMRHLGIAHLARNEPALAAGKVEASIMVHRTAKQPLLEARAHRIRAVCHLLRGDFNNARLEVRKGVRLEPPLSGTFPPFNSSEGFFWQVYQWKGNVVKSLEYMDRALHKAEAEGDRLLQGHLQQARGLAWRELGHVRHAKEAFDAAAAAYRDAGDPSAWVRASALRVDVLQRAGDLEGIAAAGDAVAGDPWTQAHPREAVAFYRTMGRAWARFDETDRALTWIDKAVTLAEQQGDTLLAGDLNTAAGELLEDAGRDPEAIVRYETAWKMFVELEDPQWIRYVAHKLEPLYKAGGRKKDAKKVAKVAKPYQNWVWTPLLRPPTMPLASGTEVVRWMLTMQRFGRMAALGRASTYRLTYNVNKQYRTYNDYIGDFEEVVRAFKATGNVLGIMQPTAALIRVLVATGGWDQARKLREDQLKMAYDTQFYSLANQYLEQAIDDYYGHGDVEEAMELAKRGIALAKETGNRWNEVDMLLQLGDMQAEQGDASGALDTGKAALAIAESLHNAYRTSYALAILSAASTAAGDPGTADQYKTRALEVAQGVRLPEENQEGWLNLGNVYNLLGEYDKAIDCLEKAIDALPEGAKGAKERIEKEIEAIEAQRDGKPAK